MNPAALKVNLPDLEEGGTLIVNTDGFTPENLKYANYASNPLEDGSLAGYRVHKLPITTLNMNALKGNVELSRKEIDRCKNFFALGVLYWLYDRPMENTLAWITSKFAKNPELAKANEIALEDRLQLRRHHRSIHDALHGQEGEDRSGQISKDNRQRSDCDRVCRRFATRRPAAVLRFVSDHAGVRHSSRAGAPQEFWRENFSGRRRNRRSLFGHRRELRRTDRTDGNFRTGRGSEAGSDRSGGDDRIAAGDN